MANKLSINEIGVNQGLAQIKTSEMFIVVSIDLDARKVTLRSVNGDEKVVSKATLERWYRHLSVEEVIQLGKATKNNGGSEDEVHEQSESEASENVANHENADGSEAVEEADATANEVGADECEETEKQAHTGEGTGEISEGFSEAIGQTGTVTSNSIGNDGNHNSEVEPMSSGNSGNGSDNNEEITAPVTPSNAGKDKDKSKTQKKSEYKNAALMKVRQTIIDTILADSPSIQLKKTTSYDVLKEKHNFAEITHGSNRFNISVMSKCLTEDQITKVKINPASFGWSIDADFTVFDETDIDMAVQLIRQSREYRLANPVTRKKKEKN